MQGLLGDEVDLPAQEMLELPAEVGPSKNVGGPSVGDKEVDIRIPSRLAPRDRAEDAQRGDTVAASEPADLAPMRSDDLRDSEAASAGGGRPKLGAIPEPGLAARAHADVRRRRTPGVDTAVAMPEGVGRFGHTDRKPSAQIILPRPRTRRYST